MDKFERELDNLIDKYRIEGTADLPHFIVQSMQRRLIANMLDMYNIGCEFNLAHDTEEE